MAFDDPLGWLGHAIDGRVAVECVVGEGGFGIVYRGRHLGFEETVAVKCLRLPSPLGEAQRKVVIDEFRGEARLLHRLSRRTAGIVQALDVGAATSPTGVWTPYIIMEWLEGQTLAQDLAGRARAGEPPRSVAQAVQLLGPAAEALAVAHAEGVAHLDVKPANLFLCADQARTMKVLDFGIAKVLNASKTLTRALAGRGKNAFTPAYAAPEQFDERHGAVGPRTDVFAFALVLLEMCTGRPALAGETPMQLYFSAANEYARPSLAAAGVASSPLVDGVLRAALEVEASKRFPDIGSLWEALTLAIDQGPPSVAISPARELEPQARAPVNTSAPTVAQTGPVTSGHNRLCTVLVVELCGTDELASRLDPAQLAALVERCFAALESQVKALDGIVDELAGEALMAVFGAHGEASSAAERAVHCALRMRRTLAEFTLPNPALRNIRLGLRVGINTGRVFVGASAGGRTRVAGTPVKSAVRLQRQATPGAVLISRDTLRHVAGMFEVTPGVIDEQAAFAVEGLARRRHDLASLAGVDFHGVATTFIGREAELGALLGLVDEVLDARRSAFALVHGAQGTGKSRLLVELGVRLEREGFAVFAARASEIGASASYGFAAALLRARLHIHDDDDAEVARLKIERALSAKPSKTPERTRRRAALRLDDVTAPLLRVLGLEPPVASGDDGDASGTAVRHRIAAAFASLLAALGGPVALVCDDLQWVDRASAELIHDATMRLEGVPLLVAASARNGTLPEAWRQVAEPLAVLLPDMSQRHLERMARDRLQRVADLDDETVAKLARRAGGNPLALAELSHLLVDARAVEIRDGHWTLSRDLGDLSLPTTILAMTQERLDRLDAGARDLLCRAAVIGRTFWHGALAAIAADVAHFEPAIALLEQRDLIHRRPASSFPEEREWVFAEGPVLEVAYDMLAAPLRAELHRQVASWLEARVAPDAGAALVARHYERAGALVDALEAQARAGRHAAHLGRNEEARRAFERACALETLMLGGDADLEIPLYWEETPSPAWVRPVAERVRLRFDLAEVLRRAGELPAAEARLDEAREMLAARDAEAETNARHVAQWEARIDHAQASIDEVRGLIDEPLARLGAAVERAERAGLHEERAKMLALVAALHIRKGDLDASRHTCLEGLDVCRRIEQRGARWHEAVSRLLRTLGSVYLHRRRYVVAERCYLQASRVIDVERDPHLGSPVLNNVAAARFLRGDLEGAIDSFHRSLELAERAGDLVVVMTVLANCGEVELELGREAVALEALEEAVRIGERLGARGDLADVYRNLARARLATDDAAGANEAVERALELARAPAGRAYLPQVLTTAADLVEALKGSGAGASLATRLVAIAESERRTADAGEAAIRCLTRLESSVA